MEDTIYIELSELDQIMPRLYVRWLLCFPLSSNSPPKSQITTILRNGLVATFRALPILRGNLIPKSFDHSRLRVAIKPSTKPDIEFKVNYHDDETDDTLPTYQRLQYANFPVSDLPDKVLTPVDLPTAPVFDIMPTFIRGGLLLCIKCHHAVVDGHGLGLVTQLLARSCAAVSNPSAIQVPPTIPSVDRSRVPAALSDSNVDNVGFEFRNAATHNNAPIKEYAAMGSHIFKFPAVALQQLKSMCGSGGARVTTQDSLTALLYGAVSYARSLRFSEDSKSTSTLDSTIGIAVNGRSRMRTHIPDYAGNLTVYAAFSKPICLPASEIPSSIIENTAALSARLGLAALAHQTHEAIAAVTPSSIASTMSLASSLQDISSLQPTFSDFYQGTDFFITSGADFPVFNEEWWPTGFAEALRIPLKAQWDGSCAVLATKDRGAGLDVLLGLREDDMKVVTNILFSFGAYIA